MVGGKCVLKIPLEDHQSSLTVVKPSVFWAFCVDSTSTWFVFSWSNPLLTEKVFFIIGELKIMSLKWWRQFRKGHFKIVHTNDGLQNKFITFWGDFEENNTNLYV